jgi:hypothetical protein
MNDSLWSRFVHNIKERTNRPGKRGEYHEGPLEHRRLGVVRQMSTTTNRNDGIVRIHHNSMAPSSMRTRLSTGRHGN